jgi:hypothetical protein
VFPKHVKRDSTTASTNLSADRAPIFYLNIAYESPYREATKTKIWALSDEPIKHAVGYTIAHFDILLEISV